MMLNKINITKFEIIAFVSGASTMIIEIVGSRILAPYVGTSIFVWTNLIAIILGALSVGYYLGGKVKNISEKILGKILFYSSLLTLYIFIISNYLLIYFENTNTNPYLMALTVSLIVFSPVSVALGTVTPILTRLDIEKIKDTGRAIGNIYAISTIGSIIGTFAAGYVLISFFSVSSILLIVATLLFALSMLVTLNKGKIFIFFGLLVLLIATNNDSRKIFETKYSTVMIKDKTYQDKPIRIMKVNTNYDSGMYLNSNELLFDYTKYYDLLWHYSPNSKSVLMIGGAGYSYPKYFLEKYQDAELDVVEIDPGVTKIAKDFFNLKENNNLNIIHEDGRVYLNRNIKKYDAILGDAFASSFPPPHLTTVESMLNVKNALSDNGVFILNIISALRGENGKFFDAEYKTLKSIFAEVEVFLPNKNIDPKQSQNIILVCLKNTQKTSENSKFKYLLDNKFEKNEKSNINILTDNFSPIERYLMNVK